jgi:predicted nucleic acid-binding protein
MITRLTIDASVFVSRLRADDVAHEQSRAFLEALPGKPVLTILPALVKPEIAGAVRRYTGNPHLARRALEVLDPLPNLTLAPVDDRLAAEAADLAAELGIKGADAVYLATAWMFDAALVTLDAQQGERASAKAMVLSPAEALVELEALA